MTDGAPIWTPTIEEITAATRLDPAQTTRPETPPNIRQVFCGNCSRPTGQSFDANSEAPPAGVCQFCPPAVMAGPPPLVRAEQEELPDGQCCANMELQYYCTEYVRYDGTAHEDGTFMVNDGTRDSYDGDAGNVECSHCGSRRPLNVEW